MSTTTAEGRHNPMLQILSINPGPVILRSSKYSSPLSPSAPATPSSFARKNLPILNACGTSSSNMACLGSITVAPWCSKTPTLFTQVLIVACTRAVLPPLSFSLTSAPFSIRNLTKSVWPLNFPALATMRGVIPREFFRLTSALARMRSLPKFTLPRRAA